MKLKTIDVNGATYAEIQDGKPVYIGEDGKEMAYDTPELVLKVNRIASEAKGNRDRAQAAEAALKAFEGITDPAAALKAIGIVANLDDKKLIDAGEAERVKADITKTFTEKLTVAEKRALDLEANWSASEISRAFANSKFIAEKSAIPADFLQAKLAGQMKFESGRVIAYDAHGNRMLSRTSPGEDAGFDEAIGLIIDAHPQRDTILRGNQNNGSGAKNNGGTGGAKTMAIAAFSLMDAKERSSFMATGGTLTD